MCSEDCLDGERYTDHCYLPDDGRTKPEPRPSEKRKLSKKQKKIVARRVAEPEEKQQLCLVRAKLGNKHISCVVSEIFCGCFPILGNVFPTFSLLHL